MDGLWLIWGAGFFTGGMASYLACTLFCRAILSNESGILAHLKRRRDSELSDSALNSFLKGWEAHMATKSGDERK